ncbi:oxidoreductase [Haliea sp. E17]|uniref:oxidoreductase n=1 Tax=Haliea sp. E17 TaxID=3401576 RepID=UPI003AAD0DDA
MKTEKWGPEDIPDMAGKVVVVTGASTGIGKENARLLANANASVILAVRNREKGETAAQEIVRGNPSARVAVRILDLASLASVEAFARQLQSECDRVDLLINNAGVMMCPYEKTADGFEMQIGTNHLGHFALTLYLLPLLEKAAGSRIVVLSSLAHKQGNLDFADLNWETRKYSPGSAYCDSKLANFLFAQGLIEKLQGRENAPLVTVAHPGVTKTDLARHSTIGALITGVVAQTAEQGSLPTLRAAFDRNVSPGDYFGPGGLWEMRGAPVKVKPHQKALDIAAARKLWSLSEDLTRVSWGECIDKAM